MFQALDEGFICLDSIITEHPCLGPLALTTCPDSEFISPSHLAPAKEHECYSENAQDELSLLKVNNSYV